MSNKDRPPVSPHGFYNSMKSEMGRALGRLVVKFTAFSFFAGVAWYTNKRYGVYPYLQNKWKEVSEKTAKATEAVSNRAQEVKEKATNTKESVVSTTQKVRELVGGKKAAEVKTDQGKVEVKATGDVAHPGATVTYTDAQIPIKTTVSISAEAKK